DSGWTGSYTVARGDSLYAIARKHNVSLNELERANKIADPRRVKPGTVLKVPRGGDAPREAAATPVAPASATGKLATDGPNGVTPTIINAPKRTAALGADAKGLPPTATDAPPAAAHQAPARDTAASKTAAIATK